MAHDGTNGLDQPKRVVFRIPSNTKRTGKEILDAYGKLSGYGDFDPNLHYLHYQPRETSHFHIIADINYTKIEYPDVRKLPHELYRVLLKEGAEPMRVCPVSSSLLLVRGVAVYGLWSSEFYYLLHRYLPKAYVAIVCSGLLQITPMVVVYIFTMT
ncbi:hypothetical protein BDY21DRAFT_367315 [Lineolata rhizophorae]|uniref:Uncharacterized protein n=1 Tax=Lineolata rhizophorae TaxID=578093 RepID=A0A6A6NP56_9PEZI|nr:hypothetical protein BDY21DRAFT_367315 [Lineolata rhizophorae]